MGRPPRNKSAGYVITVRITKAEARLLKTASFRHESPAMTMRRLALSAASPKTEIEQGELSRGSVRSGPRPQ